MILHRLLYVLLCLVSSNLFGGETAPADPRFELWLGIFRSDQDTRIRVDSKGSGLGTDIDLEDDLGLDDVLNFVVRGGFAWRFQPRHTFSVEYYGFRRDSSSTAQSDFNWEDISVQAGALVDTSLDIDILETHYEYSLIRRSKHDFRASVGLFWTRINAELSAAGEGQVSVLGEPVSGEATASAAALAPLPVLGLAYDWEFVHSWYLTSSANWFGISLGGISGRLINWDLGVKYQSPWPLSVGLNYTSYSFDLDIDSDDWQGALEWKFSGPQLFLGATF
jgi:hypothetical protein